MYFLRDPRKGFNSCVVKVVFDGCFSQRTTLADYGVLKSGIIFILLKPLLDLFGCIVQYNVRLILAENGVEVCHEWYSLLLDDVVDNQTDEPETASDDGHEEVEENLEKHDDTFR
jgi:hypothetical protein